MKTRLFYSLPPAGTRIPLSLSIRSFRKQEEREGINELPALGEFLGKPHMLYVSSGRAALWLILKTLSALYPERNKVVIPAYTCPAVASAVLKAGLTPVLCDVNLDDFGYNVEDLKQILDESILAVVVVHLFGFQANIEDVTRHCRPLNVFVVEDAAQAFGNEQVSTGRKLGLIGDVGFFSFGRGKPLSALHGGLMVTHSEAIHQKSVEIYQTLDTLSSGACLRYFCELNCYSLFFGPYLYWIPQSMPFLHLGETIFEPDFSRLKGCHEAAGVIEALLRGIEKDKKHRMAIAGWYDDNLRSMPGIRKPYPSAYPFLRYPLIINSKPMRDALLKKLTSAGMSGTLFYPCPLNELPGLQEVLRDGKTYENAKLLSDTLITLPVHEGVSENDMEMISSLAQNVLKAA